MSENAKHEGHRARLREKFLTGEAASRSDEALLELLLTYAIPQRDVQPLAKSLIMKLGSLEAVLGASAWRSPATTAAFSALKCRPRKAQVVSSR